MAQHVPLVSTLPSAHSHGADMLEPKIITDISIFVEL